MPWHVLATYRAPKGVPWQADENWRGRVFPDFTFGCHAVDVEVDLETGQVRVLRYVAAHDVGQAINPQSVEGQIEGGGCDGARLRALGASRLRGRPEPDRLVRPVPDPDGGRGARRSRLVVLESGDGMGPFNARGIGEPPIGPPAPAVAAAIHAAGGVAMTELPFTPERVSDAIRAREEGGDGSR